MTSISPCTFFIIQHWQHQYFHFSSCCELFRANCSLLWYKKSNLSFHHVSSFVFFSSRFCVSFLFISKPQRGDENFPQRSSFVANFFLFICFVCCCFFMWWQKVSLMEIKFDKNEFLMQSWRWVVYALMASIQVHI